MAEASCLSHPTNLFFPDDGRKEGHEEAKKICSTCPVWEECLKYATQSFMKFGIWGGLAYQDRRKAHKGGGARICSKCKLIKVMFTRSDVECNSCVGSKSTNKNNKGN